MSRRRSSDLSSVEHYISFARIIFLCPSDPRHELGRAFRTTADAYPEVGRVDGNEWSDGAGNVVHQGRGLLVNAGDESSRPMNIEGRCRRCERQGSHARPRLNWAHLVALLDEAVASDRRDTRVPMSW